MQEFPLPAAGRARALAQIVGGQALLKVNPDIYSGDAFFQWGSQDRYTLFSPIYGWLIVHLGLEHATITLLLLSQGLFLAASFALVRALIPTGLRGYAMVFVVCGVGLYGGRFLFRMAEPFVTPRAFVEAATLRAFMSRIELPARTSSI